MPTCLNNMTKKNIIPEIIEALQDKKGTGIKILDLSSVDGASTSAFIVATGRSTSQVSALADSVRDHVLEKTGEKPVNYDGYRNSQWIVIDYGNVMVHIFLPDVREFYRLEELWNDAETTIIPDID